MQAWAPPPAPPRILPPINAHQDAVYYHQAPFDYNQWASLGYRWPYFRDRFDPNNMAAPFFNLAQQPQNYGVHPYPPEDGGYQLPPEHWAFHQSPEHWVYHQPLENWAFQPQPEQGGFQQALEYMGYQDQAIHGAHLDEPEPWFHFEGAYQPDFNRYNISNRNSSGSRDSAYSGDQSFPPDSSGLAELLNIKFACDVVWPPVLPVSPILFQ